MPKSQAIKNPAVRAGRTISLTGHYHYDCDLSRPKRRGAGTEGGTRGKKKRRILSDTAA
jgi:hypothetical protein